MFVMWNCRKTKDTETRTYGDAGKSFSPRHRVAASSSYPAADCLLPTVFRLPTRHARSAKDDRLSREFVLQRRHGLKAVGRGHGAAWLLARGSRILSGEEGDGGHTTGPNINAAGRRSGNGAIDQVAECAGFSDEPRGDVSR